MISYGRQSINDNDIKSVTKVLKSDFLTQGPVVKQFEQNLSNFFKCKHAIAVSSGTAALNLISQVLGWKKNDIIIASPITFISSSNCILHAGATPHFVDINMDDLVNILDVVLMVNYILNLAELSDDQMQLADMNQDGIVNILDVITLVNSILEG